MPIFPTIKLNIERWKYNPTFEVYVSNMGHIKNKSKADIAPKINQKGYVAIYVGNSSPRWILLHRLVMLTWKPTPEAEVLTVDHLDHNKRNNALSNLEWVTREENVRRAAEDYLHELTLADNDNDVIIRNKKKNKVDDILGVVVRSKRHKLFPVFISKQDENKLFDLFAPYVGKVSYFTIKGLHDIIKDIYSGKNCNGYRKWCDFEVLAAYPDNNIVEKMENMVEK